MISSIYRIAEQCLVTLSGVDRQAVIAAVVDSLGSATKAQWYENKQDGISEIDGIFIYTFGKTTFLTPVLDDGVNMYYITTPSAYVRLPNEMGIVMVSFLQGQTLPFVRINAGSVGMWARLKASVLGGSQTYFSEGSRLYFPKMTATTNGNILLKLAGGFAGVDVREELNLPPDVISQVVMMVNQKFQPQDQKN